MLISKDPLPLYSQLRSVCNGLNLLLDVDRVGSVDVALNFFRNLSSLILCRVQFVKCGFRANRELVDIRVCDVGDSSENLRVLDRSLVGKFGMSS